MVGLVLLPYCVWAGLPGIRLTASFVTSAALANVCTLLSAIWVLSCFWIWLECDRFDTEPARPGQNVRDAGWRAVSSHLIGSAQALPVLVRAVVVSVPAPPVSAHRRLPSRRPTTFNARRLRLQSRQFASRITLGSVAARVASPESLHQPDTQPGELTPLRRFHVAECKSAPLHFGQHGMRIYVGAGRRGGQLERSAELVQAEASVHTWSTSERHGRVSGWVHGTVIWQLTHWQAVSEFSQSHVVM